MKKPIKQITLFLALLDLWHEWILSLCIIMALAAILAPLLLLLGLKQGTVSTLRERLVEDPVNREIRPARTLQLSDEWFQKLTQRTDITFVIPTILRGSSIVRILTPQKEITLDIVPTAENDPLLLENQAIIPKEGEVVLTHTAAETLQLKIGEKIQLNITRTRQNQRESVTVEMNIISILNPRADDLARIYAPLDFVNDIERYREGLAVTQRGWQGGEAIPYLSYDGVLLILPEKLNKVEEKSLLINTGLADIQILTSTEFTNLTGLTLANNSLIYLLNSRMNTIQDNNLKVIREKLRGRGALILPLVQDLSVTLSDGKSLSLFGLSLDAEDSQRIGLNPIPWGEFSPQTSLNQYLQILLPIDYSNKNSHLELQYVTPNNTLHFPLTVAGQVASNKALIPIELAGILRTAQQRHIRFIPETQQFSLEKSGYHGFRLYARSIDDIPVLYQFFTQQNIEVLTQVQAIERVRVLEAGLSRLFWLIAIVGILGGTATLLASLYAAVERKKREIGILRLMGFTRREVADFPIFQALILTLLGLLLAFMIYSGLSYAINTIFADNLQQNEMMCTLSWLDAGLTIIFTLGIAHLSAWAAAWRATTIEPALAIREE